MVSTVLEITCRLPQANLLCDPSCSNIETESEAVSKAGQMTGDGAPWFGDPFLAKLLT